ncbi:MAG: TolC family protein [Acidobacteriaceae bacterium]|nr:TolC family protein [Acidobacteriaceae bacterium]
MRKSSDTRVIAGLVLLAAAASQLFAQAGPPAATPPEAPATPATPAPETGDPSFRGSVPQGTASANAIPLSFADAINRGLKANLGLLTSQESSIESRAERLRSLSALLPNVSGQLAETVEQLNLQTIGISFPGVPKVVGPFSYQTAQANATVPIINWTSIENFRGSRANQKAAALSIANARDLVVLAVGDAYLQIIADAARVTATQAEIDADAAVYQNAVRRHDAGTAIGLDVLRSQVELKQRQQQLVAANNQLEKDKLSLGRVIGLAVGQDFTVTDPSLSIPLEPPPLKEALDSAYANRPDYQAAKARVLAAQLMLGGARGERYPILEASGFYGDEGKHLIGDSHGVFTMQGSITFNIFDGGRIRADIQQSEAELRNRRNELENLRGQIDYDVRSALLDLKSAADQVDVAKSNVQLATESLRQSRDRYAAGVTNTVEVVQSQQAVADANENLISAQFSYNLAKVSLARAMGIAEKTIPSYFSSENAPANK